MKKAGKILILGMLSLFFCACNPEDGLNSDVENIQLPSVTPEATPEAPYTGTKFWDIERIDWTELTCYADEETSRHNSNFLNFGYLTYDAEGNIYYRDERNHDIYVSDYKGDNPRLLYENKNNDILGWMRIDGDWLYYATQNTAFMRLNITTGEVEQLKEELSGQFRLENGKMYWNDKANGGFSVEDPGGKNKRLIQNTSLFYPSFYSMGDKFWISEATLKADKNNNNGLLIISEDRLTLLNQTGNYPLLAGKYISVVNDISNSRSIWNLETKEVINLNARTDQTVVSDGTVFYYKDMKAVGALLKEGESDQGYVNDLIYIIYKWDGQNAEEIWRVDADGLYHMFITPKGLYCMPTGYKGVSGYSFLFYDFETGEVHQIY